MIGSLAPEWDALATATDSAPFLRSGWIGAWLDAFAPKADVELFTRRGPGGELQGVLPLIATRSTLTAPANAHTPIFGAVATADARQSLFDQALSGGPRRLDLPMLDSRDADCLERAAQGHALRRQVLIRSPYLRIDGDWEAYWRTRSQNLRKTIKRCRNRLREYGEVEVQVSEGTPENLDELLDEAFRLEATGWKGEGGTAILSHPATTAFYRAIARWAADEGLLRLAFLRLGGRPAAFNLAFETRDAHYLVKMGHDAAFQRTGAGTVLTAAMLERTFERGLDRYEFLGDADRYKLRWTETVHERVRAQAFAPTLAGRADRLVQVQGRTAARRALGFLARRRSGAGGEPNPQETSA